MEDYCTDDMLSAIADFYLREQGLMRHIVVSCSGLAQDHVDDVVQVSMENAIRHRASYKNREGSSFRGWMCRIVHNAAVSYVRALSKKSRVCSVGLEYDDMCGFEDGHDLEHELEMRDTARAVVGLCRQALPDCYFITVMSLASGLTYKETSENVGCPMGTVMSRVARARSAMEMFRDYIA